ncbi:MAG: FprA family A-type flavoprotein [Desulfurococcales archaeon]|nr:FprA family A-type flavoprotein [Desulfurococcales archaeon]
MLVDPRGYYVVERVYESVSEFVKPRNVEAVFYSHQDPDVAGSLNIILDFFPNAKVYISSLWTRFIPHLGVTAGLRVEGIPDEGAAIELGAASLQVVPAHFLHSPGNHTLYDPVVGVLFSGDIGAAVFPEGEWYLFVEDLEHLEKHKAYMEAFHKRYLAHKKALEAWLSRVERLEPKVIAPQHGAIFTGDAVGGFLKWLHTLEKVGVDLLY